MSDTIRLRPVLKGEGHLVDVEGGVIRRPAATDGVVVATASGELFLPEDKLVEALRVLEARRPARARPQRAKQLELATAQPWPAGEDADASRKSG